MSAYLKGSVEAVLAEITETVEHGIQAEDAGTALLRIRSLIRALPLRDRRLRARTIRDRITRDTGQLLLLTAEDETAEPRMNAKTRELEAVGA